MSHQQYLPLAALLLCFGATGANAGADLWVLKPVVRPAVPVGVTTSKNPIDAFVAAEYKRKGLHPSGPADKPTLLRRVYLDLIGIPPTPVELEEFLKDDSPDAYEKVVDKLLANEQHGVRYARHWLDVLRYADSDDRMTAAPGIYHWRDWVIYALNADLPYDEFARTQLTGYRSTERTQISSTGIRTKVEPRLDDMFALGFLARGDVVRDGKNTQELPIAAVETVSTAFMGLTVGCAKCHDHKFDPIKQTDFYAMKALFDPLVLRKVPLATSAEIMEQGAKLDEAEKQRSAVDERIKALIEPYRLKLYEERVAMTPPNVQAILHKAEKERTPEEQKIADDYYPVVAIKDAKLIMAIMPDDVRNQYQELLKNARSVPGAGALVDRSRGGGRTLDAFWTVEVDPIKEQQQSYILTSGDPERPEKDKPVGPGWPFAPAKIDFREGRIEAFSDWLTAKENPMFARVAVNRLWQWHFGEGLQKASSDFGTLGGTPSDPELLDWLAAEFVSRGFSMKQMHRLIVTSETYKMSSEVDPSMVTSNVKADPEDTFLWHYRLQRLEAEPLWDSILAAAGDLNLKVGGPSFSPGGTGQGRGRNARNVAAGPDNANRRAAYMIRGFSTSADVMPEFLQAFDVDDGSAPCPLRTQTVTAPQALFMMNSDEIERASAKLADRLLKESGGDLKGAVDLAFRLVLDRPPSGVEKDRALSYLENDPARLKQIAWLMLNLDEFMYIR